MKLRSGKASWELAPGPYALWLDEAVRGISSTYNVPLAYRFDRDVDIAALQYALEYLLHRHPPLASGVLLDGREPRFVHDEHARCLLEVVDLARASRYQRRKAVADFACRPVSMKAAPLLSAALFRLDHHASLLVLVIHHAVCDSSSVDVLRNDISAGYAHSGGRPTETAPGLSRYEGYGALTVARNGAVEADLIGYWAGRLADVAAESTWPHDRPRPQRPSYAGSHSAFRIPANVGHKLRLVARTSRVTPFVVVATALQVLLARVAPDDQGGDVVLGTPVTLRADPAEHGLIGYLANTIPLRLVVDSNESFYDLLDRSDSDFRQDLRRAHYPFPWLVRQLAGDRSLSRPPLFQVMVVVEDQPAAPLVLGDAKGLPIYLHNGAAKFDLTLTLTPEAGGFAGELEYATDLYDRRTAQRLTKTFVTLLEDAVSRPDVQIGDLRLVSRRSRSPATGARRDAPLAHERFAHQAALRPDAVALCWEGGSLSYREVDQASARLSTKLRTSAAGTKDVIAIHARRSPELAVSLLAVLRAGHGYVPLDPAYPQERLTFMLKDSQASLLLCDDDLIDTVPVPAGVRVMTLGDVFKEDLPVEAAPVASRDREGACYVIYTSGSTGRPKGVDMPHGPLANLLAWQAERSSAGPGWRTLQFAPFSFDVAFQELFGTWGTGGTLVLVDEGTRRDPARLLGYLNQYGIHRLFLPFVALQNLAESASEIGQYPADLKEVITAGEQLVVTPAIRRFFTVTGASLENQYGPTETHVVTAERLTTDPTAWPELPSIGAAVPGAMVDVVDQGGRALPLGVPGEIWVSGAVLANGYRGQRELTAERFVVGPDGRRYYRTGDFGRLSRDGRIHYLGRRDGQVKVRGYRVEVGEVEARLKAHPGVADAVVVAGDGGVGGKRLVAHCLPARGARLSAPELRRALSADLPDYMVPAAYVMTSAFPLTASGKVDRLALARTPGLAGPSDKQPTTGYARDDVELQICAAWGDVLAVTAVGVHDNFFELGGNSFLGVRLVAAMRRLFGIDLAVADLFAAPTIAALAQLVRHGHAEPHLHGPLVRLQVGQESSPLYAFHPLPGTIIRYAAFMHALGLDQTTWGLQSLGLQPGEMPLATVGEMADVYLSHMRPVHPGGLWHLVGYSMGGVLAVEVARRLQASGERIGLVGLLDTNTSADIDQDSDYATRILVRYGLRVDIDVDRLLDLDPAERTRQLLKHGIAVGALPADYDTDRLQRMIEMYQHNGTALAAHQIAPYNGTVVLFRAIDRSMDSRAEERDLGWRHLAREVVIHDVPGDHYHMMEPGNVEVLAGEVLKYIRSSS